jgi:uncharacterized protein YlzI (FlbEa/FlbD family)
VKTIKLSHENGFEITLNIEYIQAYSPYYTIGTIVYMVGGKEYKVRELYEEIDKKIRKINHSKDLEQG